MGNLGVALSGEEDEGATGAGMGLLQGEIIAWDSHRGEAAQERWMPAL